MPAYEVKLTRPLLVSVTVDADDERSARVEAWEIFVDDARSLSSADFEAKRQPFPPDDIGDARSEARYELTAADIETERVEEARYKATGGAESGANGMET